jgi:hypothetical protein
MSRRFYIEDHIGMDCFGRTVALALKLMMVVALLISLALPFPGEFGAGEINYARSFLRSRSPAYEAPREV